MGRRMTGGRAVKWIAKFNELERAALARGTDVNDLSEMAGLNRSTIRKWIKYHQTPRTKNWNEVQRTLLTLPVTKDTTMPLDLKVVDDEIPLPVKPTFEVEADEKLVSVPSGTVSKARDVLIGLINERIKGFTIVDLALLVAHVEQTEPS